MTDLQRYLLSRLCEEGHVDPADGGRRGSGATARALAERSAGWYGNATIVRCLNALCRPTTGNADHEPRAAWTRQVEAPFAPQTGPGRQWVATPDGAAAIGGSS